MGTWGHGSTALKNILLKSQYMILSILDGSQFIFTGGNEENGGYWKPLRKTLPYKFGRSVSWRLH